MLKRVLLFFFLSLSILGVSGSHKKRSKRNRLKRQSSSDEDGEIREYEKDVTQELNWVGKETGYLTYVGEYIPEQEDYATEDSGIIISESSKKTIKVKIDLYPLIRNSGNSCAFDALLQVLLMLNFSAFSKISENEDERARDRAQDRCLKRLVRAFPKAKPRYIEKILSEIEFIVESFNNTKEEGIELSDELIKSHMKMFAVGYSARIPKMADPSEVALFFLCYAGKGK